MGIIELLIGIIIASTAGYQAGKAGQKADAVQSKRICFHESYLDREAGCYTVIPPSESENEAAKYKTHRLARKPASKK